MLTPERIKELSEKHLLVVGAGYVRPLDATGFARAIEAEARKDDESLIRQMLEALTAPVDGEALHALHMSAIAAARARLEKAP